MLTRNRYKSDSNPPSGSEYNASEHSSALPDRDQEGNKQSRVPAYMVTQRGRRTTHTSYKESDDEIDGFRACAEDLFNEHIEVEQADGDDEDEEGRPPRRLRRPARNLDTFVIDDEEEKLDDSAGYSLRNRPRRATTIHKSSKPPPPKRHSRYPARMGDRVHEKKEDDQYIDHSDPSSLDADGSVDNEDTIGTSDLEITMEPVARPEPEPEPELDKDGKPYSFRQRQKINYAIPPPLEEMSRPPPKVNGNRNAGNKGGYGKVKKIGPGWSAGGAELGRWMGMGGDDSVGPASFNLIFDLIHHRIRTTQQEHLENSHLT